ncbi:MAG: ATP-dependent helicase HrpB [Alphaproteobacteria bacterium]|nr:ATP-dependent helicase HrpB [Alphaproteobacteria bacterium]
MTQGHDLPVRDALPALRAALAEGRAAVLEAPPGAGKTTLVPLALLGEPWLAGQRILMLEPRRVAARAAAQRMAQMLGEPVGETAGYRVRLEAKVSPRTRIEVVTEALLTRRLQNDPSLAGIGLVIFDEFHERSLDSDLGLALALEAQQALRPDLRLLVMSATLDGARVAALLGGAPVIASSGRLFPVETVHLARPEPRALPGAVADTVRRALREGDGSVLVFLPGEGEIRAAETRLADGALPPGTSVVPLYGNLPFEAQMRAVAPPVGGERRVVLATAIAETSLTIPDIRAVVDSGLSRQPRFDAATGMTRLVTTSVSQAAAEQRCGRAGRLAPGRCYRLWSAESHRALPAFAPPEMAIADLAPLALDLAVWGDVSPAAYAFLDPPPAAAYAQARTLLGELEALDGNGRITAHGRAINALGLHPRLAHMIIAGAARGAGATACAVAAMLSERDVVRPDRDRPDADLRTRLAAFAGDRDGAVQVDRVALARARANAKAWQHQARIPAGPIDAAEAGPLLALAYPDRVAQRRGPRGAYRLRSGRGALLTETDALAGERFLALGAVDQGQENARIFLAAPIARADIDALFATDILTADEVVWDTRTRAVAARRSTRLGTLVLDEKPLAPPPEDALQAALLTGLAQLGLNALPWTDDLRQLQARVALLRSLGAPYDDIADLSHAALVADLDWLAPYLEGLTRAEQFYRIDLGAALRGRLGWQAQRVVDADAPTHLAVPTGSRIALDYGSGTPVLAVRLQEMFGATTTPSVARGRVPVTLHLLSPARRPVQVTRDLAGFWAGSYADVKKDLKGRYPKHRWPDDPRAAQPTTRAKRPGETD